MASSLKHGTGKFREPADWKIYPPVGDQRDAGPTPANHAENLTPVEAAAAADFSF
jgi:hypothetical protein